MALSCIFFSVVWSFVSAAKIELVKCKPPHSPVWGGYAPQQKLYTPGDLIYYYCDVETFIGGHFYRKCGENGQWNGDTPVCDGPSAFSSTSQTSDADDESGSHLAIDALRETCSETSGNEKGVWSGTFVQPGQLIRVLIFFPKGFVSYEVMLIRDNGEEVLCGSQTINIGHFDWMVHNCPEPQNTGATGLKIKSLSNTPLKICEVTAIVLTSPKCVDPRLFVENGRLHLSRKSATLICDRGYNRSPDTKLECIKDGVWNMTHLYCVERQWEVDKRNEKSGGKKLEL